MQTDHSPVAGNYSKRVAVPFDLEQLTVIIEILPS